MTASTAARRTGPARAVERDATYFYYAWSLAHAFRALGGRMQEGDGRETAWAELEASREEQRLQAMVRKPADASAYEKVTLAKAERDARIAGAEAQRQEVELNAAGNAHRVKIEAFDPKPLRPANHAGRLNLWVVAIQSLDGC